MQQLRITTESGAKEQCAREILDSVPPVVWFIRREMRAFRKGMSLPQFRTLVLVYKQPAASLSAVADHLGASLPTASRLVQGLVQQGLLARQGCPDDRRQLALAITDRGRAVLETAWSGTQAQLSAKLQGLSAQQRQSIVEAMRLLKGIFGSLGLTATNPQTGVNGRTLSPGSENDPAECIAQA